MFRTKNYCDSMKLWERIMEIAVNRSFFYPSNEIYGGVAGFYDYGPVGVLMKRKIENLWRRMFLKEEGYLEVESSIVTPEVVLKASGHVDNFTDPVVECKKCGKKIRADHLLEEKIKGFKWNGELKVLEEIFEENREKIKCPCGGELGEIESYNLMFKTEIGGNRMRAYLRPETAQGIFTSFLRLFRNHGMKLPLAVGQIGKSFRNEISPRKVLIRMREFTQMELEYFFNPNEDKIEGFERIKNEEIRFLSREEQERGSNEIKKIKIKELVEGGICNEIFAYFLAKGWKYYLRCGLDENRIFYRHLLKGETPHYSLGNIDMEVETSYGRIETIGNAYRTDFDLKSHEKLSGKEQAVFVESEKKKIIPHVFELSMGVDRLIFSILEHTFREKTEEKEWEWFDFPPEIAPYEVAVFPLMKKPELKEKSREIAAELRKEFDVYYGESGSIGRRYARSDEIGIPYAITIDYQTLEDNSVTIRYRNDGKQERVNINEIKNKIKENIRRGRITL